MRYATLNIVPKPNQARCEMSQELFSPGQTVAWDASDDAFMMRHRAASYGPGPFKIFGVKNIPKDRCSCGGSFNDRTHLMFDGCPYRCLYTGSRYRSLRKSVGHPQWVIIDNGTGEPIAHTLLGVEIITRFSGAWFKAA